MFAGKIFLQRVHVTLVEKGSFQVEIHFQWLSRLQNNYMYQNIEWTGITLPMTCAEENAHYRTTPLNDDQQKE